MQVTLPHGPEAIIEVIHGETVVDPYRWLEDRGSCATEEWIADQQRRHDIYFDQVPGLGWLRGRVRKFLNVESLDQPVKVGDRFFYRLRKENQEQACICTRDVATGHERVLVDPRSQGPYAAVGIHRISDDGSLLAYELRHGGSDAKAIHVVNVEEGRTLPDHLEAGYPRGFAYAPDHEGFYYSHDLPDTTEPHTIRFHLFGEEARNDVIVFRNDRSRQSRLGLLTDGSRLGAIVSHGCGINPSLDLYLSCHTHHLHWALVFADKRGIQAAFLRHDRILAITEEGAERKQIVELTEDGVACQTIVPEWDHEIQRFAIAGDYIYVGYLVDLRPIVHKWTLRGEDAGTVDLPIDGSLELLPSFGTDSDSLFYSHESFAQPPSIGELQVATSKHIPWTPPTVYVSGINPLVRRVWYTSRDGTEIPMSLITYGDLDHTRSHPVIMTSYGGFGVSMTPKFSVLATIMLELGATFALPNIRGGSDFGRTWHEAARARNRQVAFDDFIAAAEWLCSQGITSPQTLGIFGGSNSGLLVGAAMTQRPDLFRAVLCIAPLLDMVRYENFDFARKWNREYGTAKDPGEFHALYSYSPYHRVREEVNYPPTLFVTGDQDDRCNPAHVRKMAAVLQNREAQSHPIVVDYSEHRGHAPVLPLSERVEALTRRIAFLCEQLSVEIPSEDICVSPIL